MSWTEEKVNKLKELWGKGQTASQIAEIIGGISRNAVIGKAHRLNLSSKIKTRSSFTQNKENFKSSNYEVQKRVRKSKFRSLILLSSEDFNFSIINSNICLFTSVNNLIFSIKWMFVFIKSKLLIIRYNKENSLSSTPVKD